MTIIWYMVPEISTASDRFFLSSWTICCPFTPLTARKMKISEKWKKHLEISSFYTIAPKLMIIGYTVREIWVRDGCNCIFHCVHFLHFYPPNSPKNKNFKKKKKSPGDVIILHKCAKNIDYMLYCSWDMAHDICSCCFSFWAFFCPITSLTAQKMNFKKNEKTPPCRYHDFTQLYQKL